MGDPFIEAYRMYVLFKKYVDEFEKNVANARSRLDYIYRVIRGREGFSNEPVVSATDAGGFVRVLIPVDGKRASSIIVLFDEDRFAVSIGEDGAVRVSSFVYVCFENASGVVCKRCVVPSIVDPSSLTVKYNNHVVELIVRKVNSLG